jgi:hypothetical protein
MSYSIARWRAALFTLAVGTTLLSACGGGSGSPIADVGKLDEFLVDNFVTNLATKGGSFSSNRTDSSGNQYTLNVVYTPGPAASFQRRETLVTNGVSTPTTSTHVNFSHADSAFRVLGWMDGRGNTASNLKISSLPLVAKPGAGANMFTADLLIQNNGLNTADVGLTHKLSYDWSLVNPNGLRADICLSLAERADFITQTWTDCFQIDGTVTGTVYAFKHLYKLHAKGIDSTTVYK